MKRIVLSFFFALLACLCSQKSFAQGNLQFNQVINYVIPSQTVLNSGSNAASISGNLTVPANKVWKIESASYKGKGNPAWTLTLDNYMLFTYTQTSGGGQNLYWPTPYPIWLPAGTYNWQSTYYVNGNFFVTFEGASISIIEFNIVP